MKNAFLVLIVLALGCGDSGDSGPGAPQMMEPRELPSMGEPEPTDKEVWTLGEGDADTTSAIDCCDVIFALAAAAEEVDRADAVFLRGGDLPLSDLEPIELTLMNGKWSVDVCMPVHYDSYYYYELVFDAEEDGGTPFIDEAINQFAPIGVGGGLNEVNIYTSEEICEGFDRSAHGLTDD